MSKDPKREESVKVLSAMFESFEAQLLHDVLEANKGELEPTIDQLLGMSSEAPKKSVPAYIAPKNPPTPPKPTPAPVPEPIKISPTMVPVTPSAPEELPKKTAEERRLEALKNELVVEFQKLSNQQRLISQQRAELNQDFDKVEKQSKALLEKQESLSRTEADMFSSLDQMRQEVQKEKQQLEEEYQEKSRVLHERMEMLVQATREQEEERRANEIVKQARKAAKAGKYEEIERVRMENEQLRAEMAELKRVLNETTVNIQAERMEERQRTQAHIIRAYESIVSGINKGITALQNDADYRVEDTDKEVQNFIFEAFGDSPSLRQEPLTTTSTATDNLNENYVNSKTLVDLD